MTDADGYLVVVKPSARKVSAAVGEWVNSHGPARGFASKALAREWARDCARPNAPVWIQDAVPWDTGAADGYLVGGRRARASPDDPDRQSSLADAVDAGPESE